MDAIGKLTSLSIFKLILATGTQPVANVVKKVHIFWDGVSVEFLFEKTWLSRFRRSEYVKLVFNL